MGKSTILAESHLTHSPHDTVTVELIEADGTPAVVIIQWARQATVLHPKRFPDTAATAAKLFAEAATKLASVKSQRRVGHAGRPSRRAGASTSRPVPHTLPRL